MLQDHSFFSRPFIFFGPHQNSEDNDEEEVEEVWNFSDERQFLHQKNSTINAQPRIGLFIHWSDVNE